MENELRGVLHKSLHTSVTCVTSVTHVKSPEDTVKNLRMRTKWMGGGKRKTGHTLLYNGRGISGY